MDLMLAVVAASNEKVARIGQALTRNEPYVGGFASIVPQQLPTQSVMMAPAMLTVQPQGVAPLTTTYLAAKPLGVVQPQATPYQKGMRPMRQNVGHQQENYRGTPLPSPLPFIQP